MHGRPPGEQPPTLSATDPEELAIIERHRRVWAEKPALRRVYAALYDRILEAVPEHATALEIGAGPGFLPPFARSARPDLRWIASDILAVSGVDVRADAVRLPVRDASIDAIVAFDVLHHLVRPDRFFDEAARALRGGGRILLMEPWISPFSVLVYRFFHHEACTFTGDPWRPFPAEHSAGKAAFDGDLSVPWRLVGRTPAERWARHCLRAPRVARLNGLAYFLTRGFQPGSLLPQWAAASMLGLDAALAPLARLLAVRALLIFERLPR